MTAYVTQEAYDFLASGAYDNSKHVIAFARLSNVGSGAYKYSLRWSMLFNETARLQDFIDWQPAGGHQRVDDLTIGSGLLYDGLHKSVSLDEREVTLQVMGPGQTADWTTPIAEVNKLVRVGDLVLRLGTGLAVTETVPGEFLITLDKTILPKLGDEGKTLHAVRSNDGRNNMWVEWR